MQDKGLLPKDEADIPTEYGSQPAPEEDDVDLLGGEDTEKDKYSELASAVQTTQIKLGGPVKQAIDEQKALKSEQKSNRFLLTTLSKVSQLLWNVRTDGLNEGTITEGVQAQLSTIKDNITVIEEWLANHQNQ